MSIPLISHYRTLFNKEQGKSTAVHEMSVINTKITWTYNLQTHAAGSHKVFEKD